MGSWDPLPHQLVTDLRSHLDFIGVGEEKAKQQVGVVPSPDHLPQKCGSCDLDTVS